MDIQVLKKVKNNETINCLASGSEPPIYTIVTLFVITVLKLIKQH